MKNVNIVRVLGSKKKKRKIIIDNSKQKTFASMVKTMRVGFWFGPF